jgi:hypothetical protein
MSAPEETIQFIQEYLRNVPALQGKHKASIGGMT